MAQIENLTLTDGNSINGTGTTANNTLIGNSSNNTLDGLGGNDTLNGQDGVDTLIGGVGNDIYVVDTTTDTITELAAGGADTVQSSVTFTLVAQLENLTLTGGDAINGTGTNVTNVLIGNNNANTLIGLNGNDTLNGGSGNDTLIGGVGADILAGGTDADRFVYTAVIQSTSASRDIISGFLSGTDKIDLSAIDANTGLAGNNAFSFINVAAFSAAGQVRYNPVTGLLEANINADLAADLQIDLGVNTTFVVTDLIA